MSRVLVAGSYPPVPSRAAVATLAAVRREIAKGGDVEVVSPRPSAAHHVATLSGGRTAGTLWRLGRTRGADALVLVLERDMPFRSVPRRARLAARRRAIQTALVALSLRRFGRVELVVSPELVFDLTAQRSAPLSRALWRRADAVVVESEDDARRLAACDGVGAAALTVHPLPSASSGAGASVGAAIEAPGPTADGAVTPYGPVEWRHGERLAEAEHRVERALARGARFVLGERARKLGPPLRRVVHPLARRSGPPVTPREPPATPREPPATP